MASGDITAPLLAAPLAEAPQVVVADGSAGSTSRGFSAEEVKDKAATWYGYMKSQAKKLKKDCVILSYALQDERTSRWSKLMPLLVLAYVLSPLDLIPDCIPVLGILDDLLIAPALIWLAIKLIPKDVMAAATLRAETEPILLSKNWVVAALIFLVWVLAVEMAMYFILKKFFLGYAVVQSWLGTFLALLLVVMVVGFVVFVVNGVKKERELKEVFARGVREAREVFGAREAGVPAALPV